MNEGKSDDDDDRSGAGQQQEIRPVPAGVDAESYEDAVSDERCQNNRSNSQRRGSHQRGEVRKALEVLQAASPQDLEDAGLGPDHAETVARHAMLMSVEGPLPPASEFMKYPPEIRERMCQWNDAWSSDESARQDKLVDSEIKQARSGKWLGLVILVLFAVLSFAAFIVTGKGESFWLLSVPVVGVVGNVIAPVFSRSSRDRKA